MIISASRRTDIPAFFSQWFYRRIRERYACVRNPMNNRQVSRIDLSPDRVDCIVFWSKNPRPMLPGLDLLKDYMYYFQFTLNAYGREIEPGLPSLDERLDTFEALAKLLGSRRVIWRYDPVFLNRLYTPDWHVKAFETLADRLSGLTEKVTVSFIDLYPKIVKNLQREQIRGLSQAEKLTLAEAFARIASSRGLKIDTCAEDIDLTEYGIGHARCVDGDLICELLHRPLSTKKDKNQRPECGCAASVDLGLYNTCENGCLYCYANHFSQTARRQLLQVYDPASPLLCGRLQASDKITERRG